jgi:serine phosphatase RsbU (regulator of sigma subunit)
MAEQIVLRRAQYAEMVSAAAMQRAILPPRAGVAQGRYAIHVGMRPAREVGGDLYDLIPLDGERLALTIGDVSGKGVPAALFMAVTQTVIRLVMHDGRDLQAEIERANDLLFVNNREMMFATLFCGVLDGVNGQLSYCNCGHNPPLVLRAADGRCEMLPASGPPLGIENGITYGAQVLTLAPGDVVLLYTDGIVEAEQDGEPFGMERLEQALVAMRRLSAREIVDGIMLRVIEFTGDAPQFDDMTCMVLRGLEDGVGS